VIKGFLDEDVPVEFAAGSKPAAIVVAVPIAATAPSAAAVPAGAAMTPVITTAPATASKPPSK
jgi:hypothetical protein